MTALDEAEAALARQEFARCIDLCRDGAKRAIEDYLVGRGHERAADLTAAIDRIVKLKLHGLEDSAWAHQFRNLTRAILAGRPATEVEARQAVYALRNLRVLLLGV